MRSLCVTRGCSIRMSGPAEFTVPRIRMLSRWSALHSSVAAREHKTYYTVLRAACKSGCVEGSTWQYILRNFPAQCRYIVSLSRLKCCSHFLQYTGLPLWMLRRSSGTSLSTRREYTTSSNSSQTQGRLWHHK